MKHAFKIILTLVLAVSMLIAAGCGAAVSQPTAGAAATKAVASATQAAAMQKPTVNIATLKGPTGIGMVKLMKDNDDKTSVNQYAFTISDAPDQIIGKLTSGEVDVAALPTNTAAVLYKKTNGNVRLAALNTLGVLYVLEIGSTVNTIKDLKGKELFLTGQGATPEYAINYIIKNSGMEAGKDVTLTYKGEHAELAALMASGEVKLALLPEPFVTTVLQKNPNVRIALNLTKEWETVAKATGKSSVLSMGCIVVRKDFVQKNKAAFDTFLGEYKKSIEYTNSNVADAAALVEKYGIMASSKAAQAAIPNCNIVYIDGKDLKDSIANFFEVLYNANPASIGGNLPNEDFYYTK